LNWSTSRERRRKIRFAGKIFIGDGYIRIRPETSKTGEERLIPIQSALRHLLAPYRQQTGPIINRSANEEIETHSENIGLGPRSQRIPPQLRNISKRDHSRHRARGRRARHTIRTAQTRYVRPKFEKTRAAGSSQGAKKRKK